MEPVRLSPVAVSTSFVSVSVFAAAAVPVLAPESELVLGSAAVCALANGAAAAAAADSRLAVVPEAETPTVSLFDRVLT